LEGTPTSYVSLAPLSENVKSMIYVLTQMITLFDLTGRFK
jgi:hypothetical protein